MRKVIFYIFFTSTLLSSLSCQKILDRKPTNFVTPDEYYSTPDELQTALNGVYNALLTANVYGNNYLYMFNINTDDSYGRVTELTPSYQYDAADSKNELFWRGLYIGIERANLLLSNMDKVDMDEDKKNAIKGEALFLRAYCYFLLVSNYGGVPMQLEPTSDVTRVDLKRSTVKEVYDQITADMITAQDLLKKQTATSLGYGGRVSKTAVRGVLARVYLYMAGFPLNDKSKYAEALHWAKEVVSPSDGAPEHALNPDYKDIFLKYARDQYDVKESIWELEFWGNRQGGIDMTTSYTGRFCGIQCGDLDTGAAVGYVNATKKLFQLYELNPSSTASPNKDSYDLRRDWNCANYNFGSSTPAKRTRVTDTWKMNAGKWRREFEALKPKDKNFTPQNFPILRYADVLLMLAEAENEVNGPTELAFDALNQVRRRAYGQLLPVPPHPNVNADAPADLDQDQFRIFMRDERSRELCFEALRRNDLIRWGDFVGDMKAYLNWALANGGSANVITIAPTMVSARNVYMPIPIHDLNVNKLLTQNPGY